jgi:hypothetical protein
MDTMVTSENLDEESSELSSAKISSLLSKISTPTLPLEMERLCYHQTTDKAINTATATRTWTRTRKQEQETTEAGEEER